jgi:CBS domain-containing protein
MPRTVRGRKKTTTSGRSRSATRSRAAGSSSSTTRKATARRTTARRTPARRTTTTTTKARSAGRSGGTTATRRRTASRQELAQRTVDQVMSSDPLTIVETESIVTAARMMRDNDIGDVIVLGDTDGRVRGILTDRDVVVRAIAEERDPEQTTIGAVCTAEITTVAPDDSVDTAISVMRECAVRRLPVVENGRAVGILSIGDLAERFDERSALADISAAPPNN